MSPARSSGSMAVFTCNRGVAPLNHAALITVATALFVQAGILGSDELTVLAPRSRSTADWVASEELRDGSVARAISLLESTPGISDSGYHYFKLGRAYSMAGRTGDALYALRRSVSLCPLTAPAAFETIGDTELAEGRIQNAISAYRSALDFPIPQRYQAYLNDKIAALAVAHNIEAARLPWVSQWLDNYRLSRADHQESRIDSLYKTKNWSAIDSTVRKLLDGFNLEDNCQVFTQLCDISLPDSVAKALFDTPTLFRLSRKAYYCRRYSRSSEWLHAALDRPDFSSAVAAKDYLYHRGMLNYAMGNYNNVVKWLTKYEKRFGNTPDQVMTLARTYRKLGLSGKASHYYNLHLKLYPTHPRTHDILWYRAWQREDSGNLRAALKLYRKLARRYRSSSRGDDAFFRAALTLYKLEQYKDALDEWRGFLRRYPSSSLAGGARFWTGKCQVAIRHYDRAAEVFAGLIREDPFDYYAYRSDEMLTLLGSRDTTTLFPAVAADIETTRAWLDSVSTGSHRKLESDDSIAFQTGVLLAFGGLPKHAEFYLEPQEIKYRDNLPIQFDISSLYLMCGDPGASFRVARQFRWLIPADARRKMPFPVRTLLYPNAYSSHIYREAERNGIEPFLISAIIRQESIFNASIVSPAGAVGLMQIMPTTGETIAKDLGATFTTDSLCVPEFNVRFGAYYIRSLVKQFHGNIVLAIAAYNGGPHNARRWYESNRRDDFDLYVEDVGYTETRGYVKKVLANYWTYSRLNHEIESTAGALVLLGN